MSKSIKLTKSEIKRLIMDERKKLNESLEMKAKHPSEVANKTRQVDAKDIASSVQDCIDHYKKCSIKEAQLKKALLNLQEAKKRLKKRILSNLD